MHAAVAQLVVEQPHAQLLDRRVDVQCVGRVDLAPTRTCRRRGRGVGRQVGMNTRT